MNVAPLVDDLSRWFGDRALGCAVVGYSGGVDSTLTALLLKSAGLEVHLVVADAPNQRYASPCGGGAGARALAEDHGLAGVIQATLPHLFGEDAADEAALPILRNAAFYGVAARLRAQGRRPVVVGTANFSEAAFLGFWGKASDAAQDLYPISHLSKAQVYAAARALGAPAAVLEATPSGDLLFTATDDRTMIGAGYPQIERVLEAAEAGRPDAELSAAFRAVDDLPTFVDNILRNAFKYDLPFPNHHLSPRLEDFRRQAYPGVLRTAKELSCST